MKKIITGVLYLVLVFSFGGCGGSSKSVDKESASPSPTTTSEATPLPTVVIVETKEKEHIVLTKCMNIEDIERYTVLNSKDEIISDEENATLLRYYSENGVKRVCIVDGDAHLERDTE